MANAKSIVVCKLTRYRWQHVDLTQRVTETHKSVSAK